MEKLCQKCGKELHRNNKTGYCKPCYREVAPRCSLCGKLTQLDGTHNCSSVELRPDRKCKKCESPLKMTGRERWSTLCIKCQRKRRNEWEKEERQKLRIQFGGECKYCGYKKSRYALHFHHVDASEKYEWNHASHAHGGASIHEIRAHPERFELVCACCHIEIHQGC